MLKFCQSRCANCFLGMVLLASPLLAGAQQQDTSAAPVDSYPSAQSTTPTPGAPAEGSVPESDTTFSPEVEKLLAMPEPAQFRVQNGAALLGSLPSVMHLGPLHLASVDAVGQYEAFTAPQQPEFTLRSGVFRANFAIEKSYHRSRIAFQYQPQLDVIDGHVKGDLISHGANVSTYFALTRRLRLSVSDQFNYFGNQDFVLDSALSSDVATNQVIQNTFLERSGHWAQNVVSTSMTYDLSALTQISITPNAGWAYSTAPQANRGFSYGGNIAVWRSLSPQKSIGAYYGVQRNQFGGTLAGGLYHQFGLSYRQQIWGRWSAEASLGAATQLAGGQHWTGQGSVRLMKTFRKSSISAAYSRGNAFLATLHNGFVDQVDVSYAQQLSHRLQASLSIGAWGEVWSPSGGSSKYATANLQYNLFSSLGWYAGYTLRRQRGIGTDLLVGNLQHIVTGLRWSPTIRRNRE